MLITRLPDLRFDPDRGQLSDWISAAAKHRLVDDDRHRKNHFMRRFGSEAADQLASREPDPSISFERSRLVDLVREALTEIRPHVAQHDYDAFILTLGRGVEYQGDRRASRHGRITDLVQPSSIELEASTHTGAPIEHGSLASIRCRRR